MRRAGILLTDGKRLVRYARSAEAGKERCAAYAGMHTLGSPGAGQSYNAGPALDKSGYLRLERRVVVYRDGKRSSHHRLYHSLDGERWTPFLGGDVGGPLPLKLKVGVFAEATAEGTFKATFDQFQLTPLGAEGKPLKLTPQSDKTR